jgi:hypothetical protein
MNAQSNSLNDFIKHERSQIEGEFSDQVDVLVGIADELGMPSIRQTLLTQVARLSAERFEIMVAGRFKVGKSTFLNALLASASHFSDANGMVGPLPVDELPCTPVLTRIAYAPEAVVVAFRFDGAQEKWSLAKYREEARLYHDNGSSSQLDAIRSFDIGLPADLLRTGLAFVDSPGISEDPRRTALTRAALAEVHAGIVMFRNSPFGGTDELDFAAEVVDHTGHVFVAVNMFDNAVATDRFKAHVADRLGEIRRSEAAEKLDTHVHFVNCAKAFDGYRSGNREKVRQSGIETLEQRVGAFLVDGAYHAKVTGAVGSVDRQIAILDEELGRHRIALSAERETLQEVLLSCEADLEEIKRRRDTIETILVETTSRAADAAGESYERMCEDLDNCIERRFEKREIPSLETLGGKMSSLVTGRAAREASAILHDIIQRSVLEWAEAPPSRRGLQRDLCPVLEEGQRKIAKEYDGIEARLQNISLTIGRLAPDGADGGIVVSLSDRLVSAGLGLVLLGPIGLASAVSGWRGALGATLSTLAVNAALGFLAGAFGVVLGPVAMIAAGIAAAIGGTFAGGMFDLKRRVRTNAIEAIRPRIEEMARSSETLTELKDGIAASLREDAGKILDAIDAVLGQQSQSLESLKQSSNQDLAAKKARLAVINTAQTALSTVRRSLAGLAARSASAEATQAAEAVEAA